MKPLPPAPPTKEDGLIWEHWVYRWADGDQWFEARRYDSESDRRDAELMWRAMWPCPACGRQTRQTFAYQVDWLWRRCRCGNIWAIEPRSGL